MLNHCTMISECEKVPFSIVHQEEVPFGYPNAGLYRRLVLTNTGCHCPDCGFWTMKIHEYHSKQVVSGSHNDTPVIDQFTQRRLKCDHCGRTFMEPLPWLRPYQRITETGNEVLLHATADRTFKAVGEAYGRSGQNVSVHVLQRDSDRPVIHERSTPVFMGIDEISLAKGKGKYRLVIYDHSVPWRPQLFLMHESRLKEEVITILKGLLHPERIIGIAIDMWDGYKTAIETALPHVKVVVDAFHVIQASTRALDEVRKEAQKALSKKQRVALKRDKELFAQPIEELKPEQQERIKHWEAMAPTLAQAIRLHQKLRALYRSCRDLEEALTHLVEWEKEVLDSSLEPFYNMLKTIWNWLPEILNRFVCRISNAKTEGKNNQLRAMNKQGFSYSLRSLQARMHMKEERDAIFNWRKYQDRCERRLKHMKCQDAS
jgi:transposase